MPGKITLNVNGKASTVNVDDAAVASNLTTLCNEKRQGAAAPAATLTRA